MRRVLTLCTTTLVPTTLPTCPVLPVGRRLGLRCHAASRPTSHRPSLVPPHRFVGRGPRGSGTTAAWFCLVADVSTTAADAGYRSHQRFRPDFWEAGGPDEAVAVWPRTSQGGPLHPGEGILAIRVYENARKDGLSTRKNRICAAVDAGDPAADSFDCIHGAGALRPDGEFLRRRRTSGAARFKTSR